MEGGVELRRRMGFCFGEARRGLRESLVNCSCMPTIRVLLNVKHKIDFIVNA